MCASFIQQHASLTAHARAHHPHQGNGSASHILRMYRTKVTTTSVYIYKVVAIALNICVYIFAYQFFFLTFSSNSHFFTVSNLKLWTCVDFFRFCFARTFLLRILYILRLISCHFFLFFRSAKGSHVHVRALSAFSVFIFIFVYAAASAREIGNICMRILETILFYFHATHMQSNINMYVCIVYGAFVYGTRYIWWRKCAPFVLF